MKPELAAILNALFKINAPENNRTDIVQALLQGLPGLNQHKGIKGPPAVDTLKLNLGIPPAAGAENRFGVIGGDNAGFPNGRRLGDDVVDIELQVVAGFLKGNKVPLGRRGGSQRQAVPARRSRTWPRRTRASTRSRRPGSSRRTRRFRPEGPRPNTRRRRGRRRAPPPPLGSS